LDVLEDGRWSNNKRGFWEKVKTMSKKSKLKRKKYQYTKHEFIQAVCSKCGLCKPPITSEFCYDGVYKDEPKKFTKVILEQLFDIRHWLSNAGYPDIALCPDESIQFILQTIFCGSDFCGKSPEEGQQCKAIAGCLHAFRKQIKGLNNNMAIFKDACDNILGNSNNVIDFRDFKHKKKQKQKYNYVVAVVERKPTFFCNDGFRKEIGEILDGNND
jgi:hypothetical protein